LTAREPPGDRTVVAITVDVDADTMWTSRDAANAGRPVVLSQAKYETDRGIDLFLKLFNDLAIDATFFVPGWVGERYPDAIRRIGDAGQEIGSHGYDHTRISAHPPEYERYTLERTNEVLGELTGGPIHGYRAPYFELTTQTFEVMQDLGMTYSSNMMDSIEPYVHADTETAEIPVSWMWDDGPYYLFATEPPNFRPMFPPSVVHDIWLAEFESIREMGGMMTLILHPQLSARPSRLAALSRLLQRFKEEGAWFASCREIAERQRGLRPAD
jgi:peptidoglycan-N-acetylglucosamine deacetylase